MEKLSAALFAITCAAAAAHAADCKRRGVEVQVLGSGGPEAQDRRASSAYLVRHEGVPRLLVDAGGGSFLRFGEAGARMADLDAVLLTHLHADHAGDLAVLVKSAYFEDRRRPLAVIGPAGAEFFPATTAFVAALFDARKGAFRYLADYLPGGGGSYELQARDVAPAPGELAEVLRGDKLIVRAARVEHGPVPAIAFRIELDGVTVAFSGDTNGEGGLVQVAMNADLLIAHNAVPEGAVGAARRLHMPPSEIGRIAAAANVKRLVLSHRMLRTLAKEADTLRAIAARYGGPTSFADDLDCYQVSR